ncbi:uncharacterized protein BP01DRAFT_368017 [Aspergillus saccharolyticus JOP 1030-1]|uniref:Uncharacterized protein n=1 Tax=Aspergillus saccharolyticus JOP 1030-1 TaxID=1450539 RepID=A0A318Z5N5_9EURO|nr:hypothetical protein BP01DRAFT_368017 [Aspergillus saccharolyticus JOP 1030-1]PYH42615.1 hypothetical protein BP01DRAFT_368017 [Aspergillus saccharolyticus JOP 1030-1]
MGDRRRKMTVDHTTACANNMTKLNHWSETIIAFDMGPYTNPHYWQAYIGMYSQALQQQWPAGPMVRRLTTNQEIAGSSPADCDRGPVYEVFYWNMHDLVVV